MSTSSLSKRERIPTVVQVASPTAREPASSQPDTRSGLTLRIAICAAVIVLTAAAFSDVVSHPFVIYDDDVYVTKNTHVQSGLTWKSVAWAFASTENANWHPVTWMSHMLDIELFGLSPGGHH